MKVPQPKHETIKGLLKLIETEVEYFTNFTPLMDSRHNQNTRL